MWNFCIFGISSEILQIVAPEEDEVLYQGTSFQIIWETLEQGNTFFLFLYHEDEEMGIIQDNIPGDERRCPWKVGEYQGGTAEPSDKYRILIRMYTDQGPIEKMSHWFSIYQDNS